MPGALALGNPDPAAADVEAEPVPIGIEAEAEAVAIGIEGEARPVELAPEPAEEVAGTAEEDGEAPREAVIGQMVV